MALGRDQVFAPRGLQIGPARIHSHEEETRFPTPVREWFTAERAELYRLILENVYIQAHLDIEEIKILIAEHLEQKADNSRKIYLLLLLAIWYNTFIAELA